MLIITARRKVGENAQDFMTVGRVAVCVFRSPNVPTHTTTSTSDMSSFVSPKRISPVITHSQTFFQQAETRFSLF